MLNITLKSDIFNYSSKYVEDLIFKCKCKGCSDVGGEMGWLLERGPRAGYRISVGDPERLTLNSYIHYESQQRIFLWGSIKYGIHTYGEVIIDLLM